MDFLNIWSDLLRRHSFETQLYLSSLVGISASYIESKNRRSEIGFNIFTLTSDYYYRENFHSDIIKAFLDPSGKHNEGRKYLDIFIDLINLNGAEPRIEKSFFLNPIVSREEMRIDLLITDNTSHKAIIVENKINNAADMDRQLPRYYDSISAKYEVVGIVYLTLNANKYLSERGWTDQDAQKMGHLIKYIPAYHSSNINFHDHWILPSMLESTNLDSLLLLRQYGKLIEHLNTNSMDTISLKMFYENVKQDENLQTSISIRNMLKDLPEYLAIRIEDRYRSSCYPFKKIWRYQLRDAVFEECRIENQYFKMDIWCSETGYIVYFWQPEDITYDIKINLDFVTSLDSFIYKDDERNKVMRYFPFHCEDDLFVFIDKLLHGLKSLKDGTSKSSAHITSAL